MPLHSIGESGSGQNDLPYRVQGPDSNLPFIFADDIFLFTKAKVMVWQNLSRILQKFCHCLGQIISTHKSRIWFSPNTPRRTNDQVARIFDIPTTMQIGKYIGTPIFTTHRMAYAYQYLVDKIQKRIEGWQAKYFSMAGSVTLIKSSVASIPIYAMQTTLLPRKLAGN